jgi:hypothetical protein
MDDHSVEKHSELRAIPRLHNRIDHASTGSPTVAGIGNELSVLLEKPTGLANSARDATGPIHIPDVARERLYLLNLAR